MPIIEVLSDDEDLELSKEEREKEEKVINGEEQDRPLNDEQNHNQDKIDGSNDTADVEIEKTKSNNDTEEKENNKAQTESTNTKQLSEEELSKYPRMTPQALKDICKKNKLYRTPYLNDVLYLHYKGYSKIENLEPYTGLKCVYMECNAFHKIENLTAQKELKCLYLQQNVIEKIENLEALEDLDTLNLSHNIIRNIDNLSCLKKLNTLNIAHNRLDSYASLAHLRECENLSVLDLSHNKLEDPNIIDVFAEMKTLRVLSLMGNPVIKKIKNYRKTLIVKIKNLTYLDDRPVFPKDRACAEAWAQGGREAEKAERERWVAKERAKLQASLDGMLAIRNRAMQARKEREEREKQTTESGNKELPFKTEHYPSDEEGDITEENGKTTIMSEKDEGIFEDEDAIFGEENDEEDNDNFVDNIVSECVASPSSSKEGKLTTSMTDDDNIDTVFLTQDKINIDDLPDLEDVDVEEDCSIEQTRTVYRPKIQILDDEDEEFPCHPSKPLIQEIKQDSLIQESDRPKSTKLLIEDITDDNEQHNEQETNAPVPAGQETKTKLLIEKDTTTTDESVQAEQRHELDSDSFSRLPKHIQEKIQDLSENAGSTINRLSLDPEIRTKLHEHQQKRNQQQPYM
ncbi:dynein axonemal assembly factor 1-like [Ptychodera flava]|uniref:dynein axonemal assembly factor 1-like n=1 Tax=Ptychodera flava TaxID=63121 RepID=UPI00396A6D5F